MKSAKTTKINLVLIILLLVSIWSIIKYSKIPYLTNEDSEIIKFIFERPKDESILELFRITERLSLAYISGLIMYLLINVIPQKISERKNLKIQQVRLTKIYSEMNFLIEAYKIIFQIDTNIKDIKENDIMLPIDQYQLITKLYLNRFISINNVKQNQGNQILLFPFKEIKTESISLKKTLNKLLKDNSYNPINYKIVRLLYLIENNPLMERYDWLDEKKTITIQGLHTSFYNFVKLYLQLGKIVEEKHQRRYIKLNDEEISKFNATRKIVIKGIDKTMTGGNFMFYHNGIRYVVENESLLE